MSFRNENSKARSQVDGQPIKRITNAGLTTRNNGVEPSNRAPRPNNPAGYAFNTVENNISRDLTLFKNNLLAGSFLPSNHFDDPQMCSLYFNDITETLKASEEKYAISHDYLLKQIDINAKMREILIDWLVEVHFKFKLRQETLYLTVNIIDRFLSCSIINRSKLQLVGCTAMFIASKYEEIYAPEIADFIYVSDNAYQREQIITMEATILASLNFNITTASVPRFSEKFLLLLDENPTITHLVNYLTELTLQDSRFMLYRPSVIAAAAIHLALHFSNLRWTDALVRCTGYDTDALTTCMNEMWDLATLESPRYKAVRKKYSSSKFGNVARSNIIPSKHKVDSDNTDTMNTNTMM